MEKVLAEIEKMERDILRERQQREQQGKSSFSYQLYALRVEKYQKSEMFPETEALMERLRDIITQQLINIEDNPLDEAIRAYALAEIKRAEELKGRLTLTE